MYVPSWQAAQSNPIYRSSASSGARRRRAIDDEHHDHQKDDDVDAADGGQQNDFIASNVQITPNAFLSMCPALLVQIEQGACEEPLAEQNVGEHAEEHADHKHVKEKPNAITDRGEFTFTALHNPELVWRARASNSRRTGRAQRSRAPALAELGHRNKPNYLMFYFYKL